MRYHSDTPAKLRAAARQGDQEALALMAHNLRGIGGSLETRQLYEWAKTPELAIRAGEDIALDGVETLARALEAVLAEIEHPDQLEEGR